MYDIARLNQALQFAGDTIALLAHEPETPRVLGLQASGHGLVAYCLWETGSEFRPEAQTALTILVRLFDMNPSGEIAQNVYLIGERMHALLGNTEESIRFGEEYLNTELEGVRRLNGLVHLASSYRVAGRMEDAQRTIQEALGIGTGANSPPHLFYELGCIQFATNQLSEARDSFRRAIAGLQADAMLRGDFPDLIEARLCLADVTRCLGEVETATADYRNILDVMHSAGRRQRPAALLGLGICHVDSGELEEVRAAILKAVELSSTDHELRLQALFVLADCCERLNHFSSAKETYAEILESPHATDQGKSTAREHLWNAEGRLLFDAAKHREALGKYREILERHSEEDKFYNDVLLQSGNCHFRLGHYREARRCYRKVLQAQDAWPEAKDSARLWLQAIPSFLSRLMGSYFGGTKK